LAIVAIIPARYASTRLPGKPLSDIHGKPMVQHVYERAARARLPERVMVATDDERVAAAVRAFGGEAVMTSRDHRSGTDRLAEAARGLDAAIVVNVQGDEPLLDPSAIDAAVEALVADPDLPISTLSVPVESLEEMSSPDVVKVVVDGAGHALYFSRSPIPYRRQGTPGGAKHVGLYAYRKEALARFAALPPSPLEEAEGLEQLRALHHGMRIRVIALPGESGMAVDTPGDLERVRARLLGAGRS
jgi:3-deoxy-manno-octulosonate cytidylyltransferase (CMP-KDO synthetase)